MLLPAILCMILLSGCWDYRNMDDINIVAGVAVDLNDDDQYELTLELVNTASMKDKGGDDSLVVTAEGPTVFEAARNAKKKLYNKLYFGSMRIIIISQELAEKEGIADVIDVFLRDVEPRETTFTVISQEQSASRILSASGLDTLNVSYEISEIILEAVKVDTSTKSVQLYEVYNILHAKGVELVLPAVHLTENNEEEVAEINGAAVFSGDKLIEFLSPEDTRYFLMTTERDTRGAISLPEPGDKDSKVALEIMRLDSKPQVHYKNGSITITVSINIDYKVAGYPGIENISPQEFEDLNRDMEQVLRQRITNAFEKIQKGPGTDIYGFGQMLYKKQHTVWLEIEQENMQVNMQENMQGEGEREKLKDRQGDEGNWAQLFRQAEFVAQVKAKSVGIGITS